MQLRPPRAWPTSRDRNRVYSQVLACLELCESVEELKVYWEEIRDTLERFKEGDRYDQGSQHRFYYYESLKEEFCNRKRELIE